MDIVAARMDEKSTFLDLKDARTRRKYFEKHFEKILKMHEDILHIQYP